jgi:hypothetical protein
VSSRRARPFSLSLYLAPAMMAAVRAENARTGRSLTGIVEDLIAANLPPAPAHPPASTNGIGEDHKRTATGGEPVAVLGVGVMSPGASVRKRNTAH